MNPVERDQLASYFDRSASLVQALEYEYARPAFQASKTFFEEFPVVSIFLLAFGVLSLLPILILLGLLVFSIVGIVFFAVGLVLVVTVAAALVLGSILIFTLFVNICIAAFLTTILVSAHLLVRLLTLVRKHGLDGMSLWATEVWGYVLATLNWAVLDQDSASVGSSESSKSLVVVDENRDASQATGKEEES
ncbi:hypothetical protein L218DRAFT_567781 [Marasmius fiardii PR-910]|nr:hypothetical protein L218DRAFT_567781 [Marasmius fiardii PR-910]